MRVLTVIDVVERRVRVVGVVHDHRSAETIAVLSRQVAVVPEGAGLVRRREVVEEGVVLRDGALVHKRGTVRPVRALLEETVPVLVEKRRALALVHDKGFHRRTMVVAVNIVSLVRLSMTLS